MEKEVRVPPHNLDAEENVLGAILLDGDALSKVSGFISPRDFYKGSHELIFQSMQRLQSNGTPVDPVTIVNDLKNQGELEKTGDAFYITGLAEAVVSSANIAYHAGIIRDYSLRRKILNYSYTLKEQCYDGDLEPAKVESDLLDLFKDPRIGMDSSLVTLDKDAWERLEEAANKGTIRGLPTGFNDLDVITGGAPKAEMIILAARPSVGKTSMALSIAKNVAATGKKVGFISLEMSANQLYQRLLFQAAKVDSQGYNDGSLSAEDLRLLDGFRETLRNLPLVIWDNVENGIESVTAAARRLKISHKIDLLVIDYLQLIRSPGYKLYESATYTSGEIKALSRRLDTPVLVACQITRKPENRKNHVPRLSDLRDSGALEQDADQVWFIYRPEYHGTFEDKDGLDLRGKAQVIIAKNRNGRIGAAWLAFISKYAGFENLSNVQEPIPFDKDREERPPYDFGDGFEREDDSIPF